MSADREALREIERLLAEADRAAALAWPARSATAGRNYGDALARVRALLAENQACGNDEQAIERAAIALAREVEPNLTSFDEWPEDGAAYFRRKARIALAAALQQPEAP